MGRITLPSEARFGYVYPKSMDLPMWKKGSKESLAYFVPIQLGEMKK